MDQEPLVNEQIEMGARFLDRLQERIPVLAAFWMRRLDENRCRLCFVCPASDREGEIQNNEQIAHVIRTMPEPKPSGEVMLYRPDEDVAVDVLARKKPYPVRIRGSAARLGNTDLEEAYIYPSLPNGRLLPRTRIVGIRAEGQGEQVRQIEDDIGVIDAFIGESNFDQKFAELIRSRYGSVERFRAAYPRLILQAVS